EGGDPSKPYAEGWNAQTVGEMSLAGGTLPAARQGDMVLCGGPTTQIMLLPVFGPPTGTPAPLMSETPYFMFFGTPPVPPLMPPDVSGVVSGGRQQVTVWRARHVPRWLQRRREHPGRLLRPGQRGRRPRWPALRRPGAAWFAPGRRVGPPGTD